MGRYERSKTKSLKYGKSIDGFLDKITNGQEVDFDQICNVKRFIYYHHERKAFQRVMIFIDGVDYIFVQYYFEDEGRPSQISLKTLKDILLSFPVVTFQKIVSKYLI